MKVDSAAVALSYWCNWRVEACHGRGTVWASLSVYVSVCAVICASVCVCERLGKVKAATGILENKVEHTTQ